MNGGLFAQRINWHQALAEVLLIIAGILIALAAQNWWEERVEREAEISYLEALRSDFEANRESLEASIRTQQNLVNEGDELLNLMKAGLDDRSSEEFFSKLGNKLYFFNNWTPVTGTYDDLISSGRLLYITNMQLRRELSEFIKSLDKLGQMERLQTETFYARQSPFLSEYQDTNYYTWSEVYKPPISPFPVDTAPFATLKFWNLVVEWIYIKVDIITNYRDRLSDCDQILELIEIELANVLNS